MKNALLQLDRRIGWFGVLGVPAILLMPALYYSLTTPFGLVDDDRNSTELWHLRCRVGCCIISAGGASYGIGRWRHPLE